MSEAIHSKALLAIFAPIFNSRDQEPIWCIIDVEFLM